MSSTSTLTSKGQTTIPQAVREQLGLAPGDKLHYTVLPSGTLIVRAKKGRLSELSGLLRRSDGGAVSVEQMKSALIDAAAARASASRSA